MRKLLTILSFLMCLAGMAQKELKPIKQHLKANRPAEALAEVSRLEKDSAWRRSSTLYALAFEAHRKNYESQNEKIYLRQAPDTAGYMAAVQGMFMSAYRCERAERSQSEKPRYRSEHSAVLKELLPMLYASASYSYRNGRYTDAEEAAYLLLTTAADTLFWDKHGVPSLTDRQRQLTSLIHVQGNYQSKHYDRMFTYASDALRYQPARAEVMEELATGYLMLGDTSSSCRMLTDVLQEFPSRHQSYQRLHGIYLQCADYDGIVAVADMLSDSIDYRLEVLQHQAYALFQLRQYDRLETVAHAVLQLDPNDVRSNFYLGIIYMAKAEAVELPLTLSHPSYRPKLEERNSWYLRALQPLERYRRAVPADASVWAPRLYTIYLNLNMGKEFQEISPLVSPAH